MVRSAGTASTHQRMKALRLSLLCGLVLIATLAVWLSLRNAPGSQVETPSATVTLHGSSPSSSTLESDSDRTSTSTRQRTKPAVVPPSIQSPPESSRNAPTPDALRGRVVDDLNAPIHRFSIGTRRPGEIDQEDPSWSLLGIKAVPRQKFESDDGAFELTDLAPGEWILTAVVEGGVRSSPLTVALPVREQPIVLVCPRPSTVVGSVLGGNDAPVANASIYVWLSGSEEPWLHHDNDPSPQAVCDAQGRFRLDRVQPGSFQLLATFAEADSDWTRVDVAPGDSIRVDLHIHEGGRVIGRVDTSLKDIADREIGLMSFHGLTGWRTARTDVSGQFHIEHVAPQDYILELTPAGYPEKKPSADQTDIRKHITVRENETTEVVFEAAHESLHVVGSVMSAGAPLAGLNVRVDRKDEDRQQTATTGPDGRFDMEVNGPGEYRFTLADAECAPVIFERTLTAPGPASVTIEVPSGEISGTLLASDGNPLQCICVTALRDVDDPSKDAASTFWKRFQRAHTDASGKFALKFLSPGKYVVRAPDGDWRDTPTPRVPHGRVVLTSIVVGNGALEPLTIRLVAEGHISGRVTDRSGQPAVGAALQVFDVDGVGLFSYWALQTDATGSFAIDSIAPGTYTVSARRDPQRASSPAVHVRAGETANVSIQLP
jgi:protocatechuate 3,4-dioxygenase beta subunit